MPRAIPVADPVDIYIGQRLRALRLEKKMSQGELGAALNVKFQQIQKYERGDNRVSASMLLKAAETLGVSITDLVPAEPCAPGARRDEIGAIRGGAALSRHFAAMSPARRQILVQVASEFAAAIEADQKA